MTSIAEPEQATEETEIVERDDHNNANLKTFEVTWENGTVEHVRAHFVYHPALGGIGGSEGRHVTFTGWYDGQHKTILSARPDRIRMIRDLGMVPSLPDLDPVAESACESSDGGR
jgi:hypothetical protein